MSVTLLEPPSSQENRMRLRGLVVLALIVASAVLPASAAARARLVSVSSRVSPGDYATLVAAVSPNATCSITVHYKSGPSRAKGLYPKRASAGRVAWEWKVGTNTTPGRWAITVSCGSAGSFRTSFVVS
jgi:micrococcal nuclease